jgi:hypothetical protein
VSYASENAKVGKEPLVVVGLVCDTCSLTAGETTPEGVCRAAQTGDAKCFNTIASCNDLEKYAGTTKEIKFCEARSNLPVGEPMFPALSSRPTKSTTTISGGKGLGDREVLKVKIKDFPHHDRGIDPYYSERTYNAEKQGTFWGKWLRRNPYFEGRTLKLYEGFIGSPFSWSDFEVYEYDIVDIQGVTNGEVSITAKDVLVRTYGTANKYPKLSEGKLIAAIPAGASIPAGTSTGTVQTGEGANYETSGYVSIGSEIKGFTRSGDVFTFISHGQYGTTDEAHDADETLQQCVAWTNKNVVDVLEELLEVGASIPATSIPYNNSTTTPLSWDKEKSEWMGAHLVNGILTEPEDINNVIKELSEHFMFDVWYDAESKEVRIKSLSPAPSNVPAGSIDDEFNILKDSLKIKRDSSKRFSEIQVWYNKIDHTGDDKISNFKTAAIHADLTLSGDDKYGKRSIKVIKSRWINNNAQAIQLAGRLMVRFRDTPEIITFEVAGKDENMLALAGTIDINAWQFQSLTGADESRNFLITSLNEFKEMDVVKVTAISSSFKGRYGFVADNALADYLSLTTTDTERSKYGFICDSTGLFSDGLEAYKII